MEKIKLYNGEYVNKKYFDNCLADLINENWILKSIAELGFQHVNCLLTFETISQKTSDFFYESNKNNIVSVKAFQTYILPKKGN